MRMMDWIRSPSKWQRCRSKLVRQARAVSRETLCTSTHTPLSCTAHSLGGSISRSMASSPANEEGQAPVDFAGDGSATAHSPGEEQDSPGWRRIVRRGNLAHWMLT